MQDVVHDTDVTVLDSRYAEAYYTGHIQSALNLPFAAILNKDKTFKSPNEISALMAELNISDKDIVASCQAGITACILEVGLQTLDQGYSISMYDGSFAEWKNKS